MDKTVIDRIREMEQYFDLVSGAARKDPESVYSSPDLSDALRALTDYFDSGLWRNDFELDEQGLIPGDIKRGVLSEDGLYNLLMEITGVKSGAGE